METEGTNGLYTATRGDVDVPEWAEQFETGDEIHWTHDQVDGVQTSEVLGFSTLFDVGYPVIEAPEQIPSEQDYVQEVAVTRETWFPPFEWGESRD